MWVHTLMCERIRYNYTMEFDITTQWNRWVCTSIKLSILGYAMESVYLPPAQERRFNSIDFQHMRRIFGQKSSYFRKSYSFPIHHARTNVFHNWPANSFRSPLHHNIAHTANTPRYGYWCHLWQTFELRIVGLPPYKPSSMFSTIWMDSTLIYPMLNLVV